MAARGTAGGTTVYPASMLTCVELPAEMLPMICAIIDGRIRRVLAILIGMVALAVTVVAVTTIIHDGMR